MLRRTWQVLVNVSGTQFKPVTDVSLVGITYSGAAYTYMEPHGVPSAGDWALDRYGAIFLQGTEGVVLDGRTLGALMPLPLGPHPAFDER